MYFRVYVCVCFMRETAVLSLTPFLITLNLSIFFLLFSLSRYSSAVKRTITMLRRTHGVTGGNDPGAAGLFSTTRRSRAGLQQEFG